mgnify:CR=1 FL=1
MIKLILILLILSGCEFQEKENSVSVETFGDSLKIETEIKDGIIVKRFIDLKGVSDDGFDGSYEVYLRYNERINQNIKPDNYKFELNGFTFSFNKKDVLSFCEERQKTDNNQSFGDDQNGQIGQIFIREFSNFKDIIDGEASLSDFHDMYQDLWKVELITHCRFSMEDTNNKERPKSLLIEHYETSFSGGRNFYLITNKSDTVDFYFHNDWMR